MTDSAVSGLPATQWPARRRRAETAEHPARTPAQNRDRERNQARRARRIDIIPLTFAITVSAVLLVGWLRRDTTSLTPQSGLGYWLGIVGGSLMLLLLLYPLRKRVRMPRALGSVAFWFRTHMVLGVVGPVLIILHSNFRLGSINSNVALVAMLVVAVSGIVGRYLYGKIHIGLYGRKAEVRELLAEADTLKQIVGNDLAFADRIAAQLNAFAERGIAAPKGMLAGLFRLPVVNIHAAMLRRRLLREARAVIAIEGQQLGWSRRQRRRQLALVTDHVTLFVLAVKKAAALAFYERLFGLWHVFHFPLFVLLVMTAFVHVFAAHFF